MLPVEPNVRPRRHNIYDLTPVSSAILSALQGRTVH